MNHVHARNSEWKRIPKIVLDFSDNFRFQIFNEKWTLVVEHFIWNFGLIKSNEFFYSNTYCWEHAQVHASCLMASWPHAQWKKIPGGFSGLKLNTTKKGKFKRKWNFDMKQLADWEMFNENEIPNFVSFSIYHWLKIQWKTTETKITVIQLRSATKKAAQMFSSFFVSLFAFLTAFLPKSVYSSQKRMKVASNINRSTKWQNPLNASETMTNPKNGRHKKKMTNKRLLCSHYSNFPFPPWHFAVFYCLFYSILFSLCFVFFAMCFVTENPTIVQIRFWHNFCRIEGTLRYDKHNHSFIAFNRAIFKNENHYCRWVIILSTCCIQYFENKLRRLLLFIIIILLNEKLCYFPLNIIFRFFTKLN